MRNPQDTNRSRSVLYDLHLTIPVLLTSAFSPSNQTWLWDHLLLGIRPTRLCRSFWSRNHLRSSYLLWWPPLHPRGCFFWLHMSARIESRFNFVIVLHALVLCDGSHSRRNSELFDERRSCPRKRASQKNAHMYWIEGIAVKRCAADRVREFADGFGKYDSKVLTQWHGHKNRLCSMPETPDVSDWKRGKKKLRNTDSLR